VSASEVSPGIERAWLLQWRSAVCEVERQTRTSIAGRACERKGLVHLSMSDLLQSDVSRPSKLPTANLLPQGAAPPAVDQTSAEYLEAIEEEWNKRVDVEIETLADGMVDLVNLASVSCHGTWDTPSSRLIICTVVQINNKDKFKIAQETFQAQFRAESMVHFPVLCTRKMNLKFLSVQIRAANSLLSIVHSMKLQLLLSDEAQIVEKRDAELATTLQEKEEAKAKVAELLSELLK
jgi:mediator of RNA polymerase II transcription subunit 22